MLIKCFIIGLICLVPALSNAAPSSEPANNVAAVTKAAPQTNVHQQVAATPVAPSNEQKKTAPLPTREVILSYHNDDLYVGSNSAKVIVFEYSSLNCPHCANFHNEVFKKVKTDYIDKGLVKYVYRDFPLNRVALAGSKLAHCAGKDRYFDFLSSLFESQKVWAFNNSYMDSLLNIAKLGGIPEEKFKSCQEDKALEDFIVGRMMDASNVLKIEATPNFFVNGEQVSGEIPYVKFKELLDKKLQETK